MKTKYQCQRCGRQHPKCKLKREIKGKRLLCTKCYREKNKGILNEKLALLPKINGSSTKLLDKVKSPIRIAKNRNPKGMLLRGEDVVIKNKYGYDNNNLDGKSCSEVTRLRKALYINKNKKNIKENEEKINGIINERKKEKLNEDFLEGLK